MPKRKIKENDRQARMETKSTITRQTSCLETSAFYILWWYEFRVPLHCWTNIVLDFAVISLSKQMQLRLG